MYLNGTYIRIALHVRNYFCIYIDIDTIRDDSFEIFERYSNLHPDTPCAKVAFGLSGVHMVFRW